MFQETVTLILKHSDISANLNDVTASSANGSWENGKQKTTFRLNLKNSWVRYTLNMICLY